MVSVSLKGQVARDLKKSLGHLDYSYQIKVRHFKFDGHEWSEEELETLESFSSRFARTSDLFVSRYLRILCLEVDPSFRGSLVDTLNLGEKSGYIGSARTWKRIRELRSVAAHGSVTDDVNVLYGELVSLTPTILDVAKLL